MNIDLVDVMFFGGLVAFTAGLYLKYGHETALIAAGAVFIITAAIASIQR